MLEYLASISNYIGFWGAVLAMFATFYFIYRTIEWLLSDKLFGF